MALAKSLTGHEYRFAKTMPQWPHWYTLREDWNDAEFVSTVKLLRNYGYERQWKWKSYVSFNVNEYYYWTMGEPIDKNGKPWTILINKARRNAMSNYDIIADEYDSLFTEDEYSAEDKEIIDMIGECESVLDIGCGTGLFLDYKSVDKYIGLDPSSRMLARMKEKHPNAKTVNCKFEDFYTNSRSEKAIALYGSASYIEPKTIERIMIFADSAFLMFYKDGYRPVTYDKANVTFPHHTFSEYKYVLDGFSIREWHNYMIAEKK